MMREVKFRAWDNISDEMVDHDNLMSQQYAEPWDDNIFNDDSHTVMQYTGLKDKNGKEIYEGDIIKTPEGYSGDYKEQEGISIIEWFSEDYDGAAGLYLSMPDDCRWCDCEIIGNIYEKPELLKGI